MNKLILFLLTIILSVHIINGQTFYSQIAAQYAAEGDYEKAIELEKEGMELWERIHGKENDNFINSITKLSFYYHKILDYKEAINLSEEAKDLIKLLKGEKNIDYVNTIRNISTYNYIIGNYEETEKFGIESKEILKDLLGQSHQDYIQLLMELERFNYEVGNYLPAINYIKEVIEIYKNNNWEDNFEYSEILNEYALLNFELGNFIEAINNQQKSIEIILSIKGDCNLDYVIALGNLAQYYSCIGNDNLANEICIKSLNIYYNLGSTCNIKYAFLLHVLGGIRNKMGDFQRSINLETQVLEIINSIDNFDFEIYHSYISTLMKLSDYYIDVGNYEESIRLLKLSSNLILEKYGDENPDYLLIIGRLSNLYFYINNYEESKNLCELFLTKIKKGFGENHPNYITGLEYYSKINFHLGDIKKAIDIQSMILKIKDQYDEKNIDYAIVLGNLAFYTFINGQITKAKTLIKIAKDIFKELDYCSHPEFSKLLIISILLNNEKDIIMKDSEIITNNVNYEVLNNIKYSPKKEKFLFYNKLKYWINELLPQKSYEFNESIINIQEINSILLSKGLILNSEMEFDQFIGETGKEELFEKYNEIKSLRLQLNKLYEKPIAERYCDTDSLERHINELERKLMDESSEFGDYTRNLAVTWEDVQKGLGKKDAAIEFVHFPLNNDSTMYMAYVLRPEMESPAMVKLFEEKDLSKLNDNNRYSKTTASNLIWGKLQPELEGVENIYFAPDGILHQIAIEYFPDFEDDEKLISDRYNLYRLSSTRQLALRKDVKKTDKAIVYGGIQYDTNPELLAEESRKYENGTDRGFQPWYNLADTLSMRSGVKYLPFTLTEANFVSTMLKENHQQPILITGDEATEASFKSLSGKKNGILHIATHGFYWQEDEADKMSLENERLMFMSQFGDNARRNVEDKALTRTGLFMAGANNALSGKDIPEDVDDGILTASEIANLDLRGTDLVVLSACQTGMGDIGGDGVFGLQRGFKKAGVNSILMSLWDVDDAATGMFMTEFYRNYTEGKTKRESLKVAQDKVRNFKGEINGEHKNFSNPRYWAAFILLDGLD